MIHTGSATSPAGGLKMRTNQHLDPEYREAYLKSHPTCLHYKVLADGTRAETFYVLGEMNFPSVKKEDIDDTRQLCTLAEAVYMCWLRSFGSDAVNGLQKPFARLSPYEEVEWVGCNTQCPLRNDPWAAKSDAAGLTARESNERKVAISKKRKTDWTDEQKTDEVKRNADYQQRVGIPVKTFKRNAPKAGMTTAAVNEVVKTFQTAARLAKKEGKPLPDSKEFLKTS